VSAKSHLEAAAAYIAVAESGDAKREAYVKAADEILAAQAEDPKLTRRQIGESIGKSQTWVTELLGWRTSDRHADQTPWAAQVDDHRYRSAERKVPTRHEDRVEMVEKLLADPEVVKTVAKTITNPKTKAGRLISQEVHDQDAAVREKRREQERQALIDKALPLPAYMANMVVKINEFSIGLAAMVEDLDQLPEGRGRELVAEAIDGLIRQAERWAEELAPAKPDLRVIEGHATIAS
jgi:hypothetical protein